MKSETTQAASRCTEQRVVLHLVLTYHWFDEIMAGRKIIEYRAMSPHWKRLIWDRRNQIAKVRFQRGFERDPLRTARSVTKIDIGPCPYAGWSGDYYRIHFCVQNRD